MKELLHVITEELSPCFFVRQLLTVIILFTLGYVINYIATWNKNDERMPIIRVILSFPVGLSVFTVSGLSMLIFNIDYNSLNIIFGVITLVLILLMFYRPKWNLFFNKETAILLGIGIILAVISVSGIISIGFSNDSMYYYSAYPHEIVRYGHLWHKFDTFLTDVGQGTAVINTLPFLFGFNESFGIHNYFNISFICFFFYAVYDEACVYYETKKSLTFAIISTGFLVTCMPFVIISKLVVANVYFMEALFIVLYLNYKYKDDENGLVFIRALLLLMVSFIRIEGALFAGFTLLTYIMQRDYKKRDVVCEAVPVIILQAMYFIRIYLLIDEIYAPYTFMNKGKAVVAVLFNIAVLIYGLVLPVFNDKLRKYLSPVVVTFTALILVNASLFLYDHSLFIANVKALMGNLLLNSGWGFFAAVVVVFIAIVPKVRIKDCYFDYFFIGFLLVSFAACFARGDDLRIDLFDSGNRVLLQIVPFIVYAFTFRFIKASYILCHKEQE